MAIEDAPETPVKKPIAWTTSQRAAIVADGTNILASAGAGAGKTAALIERVFRLVSDPDARSSLETLLIVTFTRAAAAEMRERLGKRLRRELAAPPKEGDDRRRRHLQTQLSVLPRAQISTLHSFCMALLREYSDRAGLTPDFDLMDEEEAVLLRREIIEAEIEAAFADETDGATLRDMLNQMSPMAGAGMLADMVRRVHSFLESLADPAEWVDGVLGEYDAAADTKIAFDEKALGRKVRALIEEPLRDALDGFREIVAGVSRSAIANKASLTLYESTQKSIAGIQAILSGSDPEKPLPDASELLKVARKPSGKSLNADEVALARRQAFHKPAIDAARKKLGDLPQDRSLASILEEVVSTRPYAELFLRRLGLGLVERLGERYLEERRLTFAQLERLSLTLLRSHEDVRGQLRDRFTHVLVDEYQDVNELQAELIAAVSRPAPGGNEFVVGDVKQSIYGFRQADPTQFLGRANAWPKYDPKNADRPGAVIHLRENFRTTPPLLRELNRFFERLFSPALGGVAYDDSHRFIAGREEPEETGARLSIHFLEGEADEDDDPDDSAADANEREARHVASTILQLGPPWGAIAVLLRNASKTAAVLTAELRRAGIPSHTRESLGFLEQQEVLDAVSLMRTVRNPYDEVALVGCLRGPAADWTENDLALLRLAGPHARLFDTIKRLGEGGGDALGIKCGRFVARIREWQRAAAHEPMARFMARIEDDLHLRERLATLPNGDGRVRNLEFLARRAVQFDAFRRKGVGRFLDFVEDLLDREGELGQPPSATVDDDVVRVMPIHKSKGLEFDTVVVPFLGRPFNFIDSREPFVWDRQHGFGTVFLPGLRYAESRFAASRLAMAKPMNARTRSEEMRLLYVAATRARERLVLTASRKKMGKYLDDARTKDLSSDALREKDAASANDFLGWIATAVRDREEFGDIGPDAPESAIGRDGLQLRFVDQSPGENADDPQSDPADATAEQVSRWNDAQDAVGAMIDRVVLLSPKGEGREVRAKVSATEAKRAWEAMHSEENPAWEPDEDPAPAEEPEWWPPTLVPEASRQPDRGHRPGTLTHRFCALVDLDAIAGGTSCGEELRRLTEAGFFAEEEARLVRAEEVERFFCASALGQRVLHARATVRREVPFTIRVRAGELYPESGNPEETLLFQGVVDLLFDGPGSGVELLDFKTDWWDGTTAHFDRLEAMYTPQLALYRAGIERSLGRPVEEAWLYFLRAEQETKVPPAEDWLKYLRPVFGAAD